MLDATVMNRARFRFHADRLPVSKRPVVAILESEDSSGLEILDSRDVILSLDEDATLEDARRLAEDLNRHVRHVSSVRIE